MNEATVCYFIKMCKGIKPDAYEALSKTMLAEHKAIAVVNTKSVFKIMKNLLSLVHFQCLTDHDRKAPEPHR